MSKAPVIIAGSGVAGLCAATELLSRGMTVELVDRAEKAGPHGCSWWAGGMLAPWCEGESTEEIVVRLGTESIDWWEKSGVQVTRNGSLVVALGRDRNELKRFGRRTGNFREVDASGIGELEPDMEGKFSSGLYFPDEAHISPRDALRVLEQNLTGKGGTFTNREIGSLEELTDQNPGSLIVDCRGLEAKDRLPDLRGVKGEMLILSCPEIRLSRPVRLLHPRIPLYIVPRGDGVYMLGATQLESGNRSRISARSMLELLSAAYALNPAFGEAEILETGVDARPAFPDNLPRISRSGNIISLNGLFRHGYLLAPAMARMLGEYICDNKKPEVWHEYPA